MADKKENTKTLAQNKKARHEYFILETIEAGIELAGTEVKSARLGKVNLTDAYASIKNGEVFIKQMNISPFEQGNIFNRDPLRDRKLLLHKKEILKLTNQMQQDGYALIPLAVYLKGSLVKVSLAIWGCNGFDGDVESRVASSVECHLKRLKLININANDTELAYAA